MPVSIPETHVYLLTGPYDAVLTTIAPDGQPENTIVWCSWDGEHVLVNTTPVRRKTHNVRQNPLVALTVLDPADSGLWIDVRGTVTEIVPDLDFANINAHAKIYAGRDTFYDEGEETEERVVIRIRPTHIVTF